MRTKEYEPLEINYGKLPPQDINLERLVLGVALIDRTAIITLSTILKPSSFYYNAHEIIWKTVMDLYKESNETDYITVTTALKKQGKLEDAGGAFYITQLVDRAHDLAQIQHHALYLKELQFRRDLITAQTSSIQKLYEDTEDVFECLIDIKNATETVIGEIQTIQTKEFKDQVITSLETIKEAAKNDYKTGVPFYLPNLDRYTGGAQKSDLIIWAARPSMGKSALMLDCARKQAKNGVSVGIFSIEMSAHSLIMRFFAQETKTDLERVSKGALRGGEWQVVDETALKMMEYPIIIEDLGGIGVAIMQSKARAWAIKYGIEILYVDYLQLASDDSGNSNNREQEVANISRGLKKIAKDLNIPVVALAQLNRSLESRADKRPLLSDLRESGGIEQDADVVMFLYRDGYYAKNDDPSTELIIAKYRNGKIGTVHADFNGATQSFTDKNPDFYE